MHKKRRRQNFKRNHSTLPKKKVFFWIFGTIILLIVIKVMLLGISYGPVLWQLVFNRGINLSMTNGKVNMLLLGIGGGSHDGPNLTDTIIFASVDPKNDKVTLLSIPRDLWVPEMHGKINTAYAVGQDKMQNGGLVLAKAMIEKVTGQQINYGVVIDFSGFVKAVDLVDGLDVYIDTTFDDYQYPISGKENDTCGHTQAEVQTLASASAQQDAFPCRYNHVHFDKGNQHLNGEQALEYVRSRHGNNGEGSDFARSKRQQKIIVAFKEKLFSAGTLLNPAKVFSLYSVLKGSIDTDIPQDSFDDFFRLAQEMKKAKIQNYALDEGNGTSPGLLINPTDNLKQYDFAWVLTPRIGNGNYSEIQDYVSCIETKPNCTVSENPQ